jgi:hypothetical protein
MYFNVGKVHIILEPCRFHWRVWREVIVENDLYLQDYYNYLWHVTVGWLWFSAEICRNKT